MNPFFLSPGYSFGGPLDNLFPKESLGINPLVTHDPSPASLDVYWMDQALRESLLGCGSTNPNPSVGCILVDANGKEISRGFTQPYRGLHAETIAFQKVDNPNRLRGGTAFVTLEPCSHFGNQPPCADLLAQSALQRVVIACGDPDPRVNGRGTEILRAAGKQVQMGTLRNEAAAWNFPFFAHQILKRPVFALKWAQTLDGQLADDSTISKWITSDSARSYAHWLRQRYDAILVGANTLLMDAPLLNIRHSKRVRQEDPFPLLFDPAGICLEISVDQQKDLLARSYLGTGRSSVYLTTRQVLEKTKSVWLEERSSVRIFALQGNDLINELWNLLISDSFTRVLNRPLQSVLVEGGAKTLRSFLEGGLADVCHLFIAPKLTGGIKNRIQLNRSLNTAHTLKIASSFYLDPDVVIEMISHSILDKMNSVLLPLTPA